MQTTSMPLSRWATDFNQSPLVVFYETTRACDLACRHCRAKAHPCADPNELSTSGALALVEHLAQFPVKPVLVLTGGDPFKRDDLFDIIEQGVRCGLEVAITPSATPLATREKIRQAKAAGVTRFAVSLDGATAATHDKFRGFSGSFARTFEMLQDASDAGLEIQVNTTILKDNVHEFEAIADLIAPFQPAMWSLFFLIPVGRARSGWGLSADECEMFFHRVETMARRATFPIKTTEAPHYKRYVLQGMVARGETPPPMMKRSGVTDGRGVMFVSHTGEICPSGFLPEVCGVFPSADPVSVYQSHPLFVALREPQHFEGKCGRCEFNSLCGGSRARALAVNGSATGSDPLCAYLPEAA